MRWHKVLGLAASRVWPPAMIARVSERTVPEPADQADIAARYQALLALHAQATRPSQTGQQRRPCPPGQACFPYP
jgi:hypothetical protein